MVVTTLQTKGDALTAVWSQQGRARAADDVNAWARSGRSRSVRADPYRGTPLWRRLTSAVSIGAIAVLGGVFLAAVVGGVLALAAIAVQAALG